MDPLDLDDFDFDAPEDPTPARPVCPACWTERSVSGDCGCDEVDTLIREGSLP